MRKNPPIEKLEAGHISAWLQQRFSFLKAKAKRQRTESDTSKVIGVGSTFVGLLLYASPVGPLCLALGAVSYISSVVTDKFLSGKLRPIPMVRKDLGEMISTMGSGDDRNELAELYSQYGINQRQLDLLDLFTYLDDDEEAEAKFLFEEMEKAAIYLEHALAGNRRIAYEYMLKYYDQHGALEGIAASEIPQSITSSPVEPELDQEKLQTYISTKVQTLGAQHQSNAALSSAPAPTFLEGIATQETETKYDTVFKEALTYPVVSIVAPQGKGKSTLVKYLLGLLECEHLAVVDAHALGSDYPGNVVLGAGMEYEVIDNFLLSIRMLIKARYKLRAQESIEEFPGVVVIAEEVADWEANVKQGPEFLKESLTDFRKACVQLIKISQGDTNAAQGGGKGMAKMRALGEAKITIKEKGQATVKMGDKEISIVYPLLSPSNRVLPPPPLPSEEVGKYGYQISFDEDTLAATLEPLSSASPQVQSEGTDDDEHVYVAMDKTESLKQALQKIESKIIMKSHWIQSNYGIDPSELVRLVNELYGSGYRTDSESLAKSLRKSPDYCEKLLMVCTAVGAAKLDLDSDQYQFLGGDL